MSKRHEVNLEEYGEGFYWACEFPEQPATDLAVWCDYCPKCLLLLRLAYETGFLNHKLLYGADGSFKSSIDTQEFFECGAWQITYDRAVADAGGGVQGL